MKTQFLTKYSWLTRFYRSYHRARENAFLLVKLLKNLINSSYSSISDFTQLYLVEHFLRFWKDDASLGPEFCILNFEFFQPSYRFHYSPSSKDILRAKNLLFVVKKTQNKSVFSLVFSKSTFARKKELDFSLFFAQEDRLIWHFLTSTSVKGAFLSKILFLWIFLAIVNLSYE